MPSSTPDGAAEGRRRKKKALDRHELLHRETRLIFQRALVLAALLLGRASSDDALDRMDWPADVNPNARGCPCRGLSFMRYVDRVTSRRPSRNGNKIDVYEVADRAAAEAWLAANPAPVKSGRQQELFPE